MCAQLIELWETYLWQLDADEDGPPLMPAGVHAEAEGKSDAQMRREAAKAQLEAENAAETASLSGTTAKDDGEEGSVSVRDSEDIIGSGRAGEV